MLTDAVSNPRVKNNAARKILHVPLAPVRENRPDEAPGKAQSHILKMLKANHIMLSLFYFLAAQSNVHTHSGNSASLQYN